MRMGEQKAGGKSKRMGNRMQDHPSKDSSYTFGWIVYALVTLPITLKY